jgi:hypothetical protein
MTETLELERHPSESYGTFGVLLRNGAQIAVTCEPVVPAIPLGTYLCQPHNGPKFQNVWEVCDVPGHTGILIHNGNTIKDTEGCVLVGSTFGRIDGMDAVIDSVFTLDRLRATLPDTFYLTITQTED